MPQSALVVCHAMGMAIRTLTTREVYRNPWLRLREDAIERNNGAQGIYSVVDKQDCAIIMPIDGDHIWLVEQYRYTIGERALELPQGGWEADNVDPEALARGELKEETGLTAGRMTEFMVVSRQGESGVLRRDASRRAAGRSA